MRSVNPLVQGQSARSGGKKCAEQEKRDLDIVQVAVDVSISLSHMVVP